MDSTTTSDTLRLVPSTELLMERRQSIAAELEDIPGIREALVSAKEIRVVFEPQIRSRRMLEGDVRHLGLAPASPSGRSGPWARFIQRMIRSNRRIFGSQAPDCCTLHTQDR